MVFIVSLALMPIRYTGHSGEVRNLKMIFSIQIPDAVRLRE